jgi:hypothetical protein
MRVGLRCLPGPGAARRVISDFVSSTSYHMQRPQKLRKRRGKADSRAPFATLGCSAQMRSEPFASWSGGLIKFLDIRIEVPAWQQHETLRLRGALIGRDGEI